MDKKNKKYFIFPNKSAVLYFARLNLLTRPGRSLLFTVFFLMVAASSFVLMAELYANADDALTKNYSQDGYPYENETRLDVRHSDGSAFTDEEIEEIRALSYVDCVDPWDVSNDFNYYMEKGVDYRIIYGYNTSRSTSEITSPSFLKDDRFVRSSDCISEEDLVEGELPDELTEIVLYSEDGSQLGHTIRIYIRSSSIWGYNEWCYYDMKVVGLLARETDQVYFSPLMCHMLSSSGEVGLGVYVGGTQDHIPVIGVDLTGNNARMSDKYPVSGAQSDVALTGYQDLYLPELNAAKDTLGKKILELGEAHGVYVETGSKFQQKLLEMSEEFFLELFPMETTEIAVYLTSYGRTDKALRKLESMGYEAVSTWRVSVDGYNTELVRQRMATIGICSLGLLMLLLLGWLIVRAMLGLCMKDVILLRKLGMKKQMAAEIGAVENACFGIAGMLLGMVVVRGLWQADVYSMRDLFGYVDWYTYVAYVVYNLVFCVLAIQTYVWKCCHAKTA